MLRRRLTVTVLVLLLAALAVTVGATLGAAQDWSEGPDAAAAQRELVGRIAAAATGTALVALVLGGVAAWFLVGRQLEGVTGLVGVARRFGGGERDARMPEARQGTEAAELAAAFNAMADDLDAELERRRRAEADLRRFLADASHELRTPIATVRGYAELFRRGAAEDPAQLATAMARIESESARIGTLVEGMLALASSQEIAAGRREPVPLRELAADAVDAARVRDPERRWLLADGPEIAVTGDPASLRRALDNLLANVSAHTPPATTATVRVGYDAECALIMVTDDGPGLAATVAGDPFERFNRGRTEGDQNGAGLGLAIVQAIAASHGGSARIEPAQPGEGLTITLRLSP